MSTHVTQSVYVDMTDDMQHIRATFGDGSGTPLRDRAVATPDRMARLAQTYLDQYRPGARITGEAITAPGNCAYVFPCATTDEIAK